MPELSEANRESYFGKSDSLFVNARIWGLMLTAKFISLARRNRARVLSPFSRTV